MVPDIRKLCPWHILMSVLVLPSKLILLWYVQQNLIMSFKLFECSKTFRDYCECCRETVFFIEKICLRLWLWPYKKGIRYKKSMNFYQNDYMKRHILVSNRLPVHSTKASKQPFVSWIIVSVDKIIRWIPGISHYTSIKSRVWWP